MRAVIHLKKSLGKTQLHSYILHFFNAISAAISNIQYRISLYLRTGLLIIISCQNLATILDQDTVENSCAGRIWGSHNGGYLLIWSSGVQCSVVRWKSTDVRWNLSCSDPLDVWVTLVSFLAYFSTLKMGETISSKTSTDFQQITRRYIPEDRTILVLLLGKYLSPDKYL
jgi:hypothetical protein